MKWVKLHAEEDTVDRRGSISFKADVMLHQDFFIGWC